MMRLLGLTVVGIMLMLGGAISATPASAAAEASVYTAVNLNLRTGPGFGYDVITVMDEGSVVTLTGEQSGPWAAVSYQGISGWAWANYLSSSSESAASQISNTGSDIEEMITTAALRYGQSPGAMLAVARCESGFDPGAVNPSSGAAGLFQFLPGTWQSTPYADYSVFNPWASANAAAWMWSVGRRGEWVC